MNWWDWWPVVNTVVIVVAIPLVNGLWKIRKDDLSEIRERFKQLEDRFERHILRCSHEGKEKS